MNSLTHEVWHFSTKSNIMFVTTWLQPHSVTGPQGKGVLPEKLGMGVQHASQNPFPIYDQNLRFSIPYLWPYQKFDTLF